MGNSYTHHLLRSIHMDTVTCLYFFLVLCLSFVPTNIVMLVVGNGGAKGLIEIHLSGFENLS